MQSQVGLRKHFYETKLVEVMEFQLSCAALNMPANLENAVVAKDQRRSIFIPISNKGNAKECSNYHTIALISHAGRRRQ